MRAYLPNAAQVGSYDKLVADVCKPVTATTEPVRGNSKFLQPEAAVSDQASAVSVSLTDVVSAAEALEFSRFSLILAALPRRSRR